MHPQNYINSRAEVRRNGPPPEDRVILPLEEEQGRHVTEVRAAKCERPSWGAASWVQTRQEKRQGGSESATKS